MNKHTPTHTHTLSLTHTHMPVIVISSARKCVDELLRTCDDCLLEMVCRNPQLVMHCRMFMQRYCQLVVGRLALELSYYFDRGHGREERGEKVASDEWRRLEKADCALHLHL